MWRAWPEADKCVCRVALRAKTLNDEVQSSLLDARVFPLTEANLFITEVIAVLVLHDQLLPAIHLWRVCGQLAVVVTPVSQFHATHSQSVVVRVGKVQGIAGVAAVRLKQDVWPLGRGNLGCFTWKPTVRSTRFMSGREMENQETSLSCRAVTRHPSRACMT